jgi:hypothetical protein
VALDRQLVFLGAPRVTRAWGERVAASILARERRLVSVEELPPSVRMELAALAQPRIDTVATIAFVIKQGPRVGGRDTGSPDGTLSAYEALSEFRILVCSGKQVFRTGGITRLQLGGGSYCQVELIDDPSTSLCVEKSVYAAPDQTEDSFGRHAAEARWLQWANNSIRQRLFPRVRDACVRADRITVTSDFVPAYSLGELVAGGRISAQAAADRVVRTLQTLEAALYCHTVSQRTSLRADGYLPILERRTAELRRGTPPTGLLRSVLDANELWVNGFQSRPYPALIDALRASDRWPLVLSIDEPRMCHGDLVLEDILATDSTDAPFLVDPNPSNCHPVFDLAKMLLSLELKYESFYFDAFRLSVSREGQRACVTIELCLQDALGTAAAVQTELWPKFLEIASRQTGLPCDAAIEQVRMTSALQCIGLATFHLFRHRNEERATAFLALGLMAASRCFDLGDAVSLPVQVQRPDA